MCHFYQWALPLLASDVREALMHSLVLPSCVGVRISHSSVVRQRATPSLMRLCVGVSLAAQVHLWLLFLGDETWWRLCLKVLLVDCGRSAIAVFYSIAITIVDLRLALTERVCQGLLHVCVFTRLCGGR